MDQLLKVAATYSTPDLTFEMGRVLLRGGDPEEAEPVLARSAADEPYQTDNWLWLARAYTRMGRPERAVDAIRRGLSKLDPSGQFAPPAPRLPETAAVRATEIKRSERAPLLGALGEALIRLGRAEEALPPLAEAIDAQPGDPWLQELWAAAQAAATGEPPNLLFNPSFTVDDAWLLLGPGLDRPHLATLPDGLPSIAGGRAQLVQRLPNRQVLVQEIPNLAGDGVRYRLTAHVRGEQLGAGRVQLLLVTPYWAPSPVAAATTASEAWTTLELEPVLRLPTPTSAFVVIALTEDAPAQASAWVDEVTLTAIGTPR